MSLYNANNHSKVSAKFDYVKKILEKVQLKCKSDLF